jgi:hypothetical protein
MSQQPQAEVTGRIDGSIPAKPRPAFLTVSLPDLDDKFEVHDTGSTVIVYLNGRSAIHVNTAAQAREFVRAFALALEMLTPARTVIPPAHQHEVNPTTHALELLPDLAVLPAQDDDLPFGTETEPAS